MMINKIATGALLVVLVACTTKVEISVTDNEAVVQNMFEAFNRHDWKGMADFYIDSASFLDPSFGMAYVKQSRDQIIAKYSEMQAAVPDIHDELMGVYPSGDKVIVEFVSTGKAQDGTAFRLPISSVLTIKDGKIIKDATYYDQ